MRKSADAFRTISEVAAKLGVPKHVLRFWEGKFPQIRPMKRGGGRRYYRPEDLDLLRGVRQLLHGEGYTIKGVQKILREQGVEAVKQCGLSAADEPDAGTPTAAAGKSRNSNSGRRDIGGGTSSSANSKSKAAPSRKPGKRQAGTSAAPGVASNRPGSTLGSPADRVGNVGADGFMHDTNSSPDAISLQQEMTPELHAHRKAALLAVVKELEECRDVLRGLTAAAPQTRSSKSKSRRSQG